MAIMMENMAAIQNVWSWSSRWELTPYMQAEIKERERLDHLKPGMSIWNLDTHH